MKKLFLVLGLLFALLGSALAAVNINTATREELDSLKGIGPSKAQAIIDYRKKNGPFKSVDDLQNVNGIGPKTLDDIRKDISISGSTTAAKPVATSTPAATPAKSATAPAKAAEPAKTDAKADARKADKAAAPAKAAEPAKADAKKDAPKIDAKKAAADSKKDDKKSDTADKKDARK